ncbi:hypothetical protein TVNIR_0238 [Thioalkalivibrio nitratireducens DSM 14787]|uniref:Uncharacterized protein n=1 Tax=Thioalkalivibrio nitratireducens (strain DSM 14787 / UNIQEM 213 / ALEN2) TaxID=1255043 RepID=L0DSJ7_THIND|nr:hypothetical protein TVNIR_0238 [Thioalkalivibrio nitratireducens DSM 14787]
MLVCHHHETCVWIWKNVTRPRRGQQSPVGSGAPERHGPCRGHPLHRRREMSR